MLPQHREFERDVRIYKYIIYDIIYYEYFGNLELIMIYYTNIETCIQNIRLLYKKILLIFFYLFSSFTDLLSCLFYVMVLLQVEKELNYIFIFIELKNRKEFVIILEAGIILKNSNNSGKH